MQRRLVLILAGLALVCCACSRQNEPAAPAKSAGRSAKPWEKIDLTTPDRALKGYWAFRDWGQQQACLRLKSPETEKMERDLASYRSKLVTGEMLTSEISHITCPEQFEREIVEAKQETDSRAVIVTRIKNVTLIPEDAAPTKTDLEERENGTPVRYVLEKDSEEWKVSEIWIRERWDRQWRKWSRPSKPLVPTIIYGGL